MSNIPSRTLSNSRSEHLDDHNEMAAFHNLIDAKGDLIVGTAADTAGRLPVGTPGQVPVAQADGSLAYGNATASPVETVATANTTAAYTVADVTTATIHNLTMTANATFTFPSAGAGKSFLLALTQDGTGSRTATWPSTVKWPAGTAPTLSTTAGKTDLLSFVCVDGTNWLGALSAKGY